MQEKKLKKKKPKSARKMGDERTSQQYPTIEKKKRRSLIVFADKMLMEKVSFRLLSFPFIYCCYLVLQFHYALRRMPWPLHVNIESNPKCMRKILCDRASILFVLVGLTLSNRLCAVENNENYYVVFCVRTADDKLEWHKRRLRCPDWCGNDNRPTNRAAVCIFYDRK